MWYEQTNCYATELREFKQQMVAQIETLDKETLRTDLDRVGTHVELEMDYLETQNGAQLCVDLDDKLVEQQVTVVKEKSKAKCDKLRCGRHGGRCGDILRGQRHMITY